jgi:N-acyl-phosphatidylethanolamine-hydrolysing phospholipase D
VPWRKAASPSTLPVVYGRPTFLVLSVFVVGCASVGSEPLPGHPAHHVAGGFRNPNPDFKPPDGWTRWSFVFRRAVAGLVSPRRFDAPRVANDGSALRAAIANPRVTWIGHSTLLVQLAGVSLLTDPHWGTRASPVSWAGPRRLAPPGVAFGDLPPVDVVLLSHDHYDHLDLPTVKRLAATHAPLVLAPLGLKAWLERQGIGRVEELDWWQEREYHGLRFVCVPAQHFAQRTPWDRDRRLWASWAVLGPTRRFYFGGDSGYFVGFKEAGDRLGPFDLSALAIGAYMPPAIMQFTHTTPEQAVRASVDLRSRVLLGIHWGTFDLAEEPLDESPRRMLAEAERLGIRPDRVWTLKLGETRGW